MKTLNDKRLWIATKEKEKKKRIKEHRDELNNNDHWEMEKAWNTYIKLFWKHWELWKRDKVLVDANGYVHRIRTDIEKDHDEILDDNVTMWMYGSQPRNMFYEKTEKLFNY